MSSTLILFASSDYCWRRNCASQLWVT